MQVQHPTGKRLRVDFKTSFFDSFRVRWTLFSGDYKAVLTFFKECFEFI